MGGFLATHFMRAENKERMKQNQRKRNNEHKSGHWTWTLFKVSNQINIHNMEFFILNGSFSIYQFIQYYSCHVHRALDSLFLSTLSLSLSFSYFFFISSLFFGFFHSIFFFFQFEFYIHVWIQKTDRTGDRVPLRLLNEWMNVTLRFKLLIGTIINLDAVKEFNTQKMKETNSSISKPESTIHTIWLGSKCNERKFFCFSFIKFNLNCDHFFVNLNRKSIESEIGVEGGRRSLLLSFAYWF